MLPIVTSNNVMGVSCSKSMRLVGSGWFKTPSKCSFLLLKCSSSVINVHPSLILIGMLEILLELVNSRTTRYILLASFLFAAYCASAPFDYIQCIQPLLQFFFTSLSFFLYFISFVFHPREPFVWSRVLLVLFRSSIRSHVSRISTSPCWFPFSSPISLLRYLWRRSQTSATAPRDLWNVLELQIGSLIQCGNSLMPSVL